jgi:hypothetical protein
MSVAQQDLHQRAIQARQQIDHVSDVQSSTCQDSIPIAGMRLTRQDKVNLAPRSDSVPGAWAAGRLVCHAPPMLTFVEGRYETMAEANHPLTQEPRRS